MITKLTPLLILAGFLGLLVFGVVKKAPSDRIDSRLAESKPTLAPEFRLKVLPNRQLADQPAVVSRALSDGWLSLSELRGNPVVINFWASWCQPCRDEARFLERTSRRATEKGVVFVGVNVLDLTNNAAEFMSEFDVSYPNVRDPSLDTARDFEARAMPETFFLSRSGEIVSHVIGVIEADQMVKGLLAADSGKAIPVSSGGASRPAKKP